MKGIKLFFRMAIVLLLAIPAMAMLWLMGIASKAIRLGAGKG